MGTEVRCWIRTGLVKTSALSLLEDNRLFAKKSGDPASAEPPPLGKVRWDLKSFPDGP